MSQLGKALQVVDSGDRLLLRPKKSSLFNDTVSIKAESYNDPMVGLRYRVGCKIEASCVVSPLSGLSYGDKGEEATYRVKRQIIEAIFGEFRNDIMRIHSALNDYDVDSARDLLSTLERNMFDVS